MTPDKLIGKRYDEESYHCWHFIEECISVPKLDDIAVSTVKNDIEKYKDLFTEIKEPIDNCIALLGDKHVGIYYNRGIYHNDVNGVSYHHLRAIKIIYPSIKYYKVDECNL